MIEVFFLGILQGVAEFLPISSSGHLVVARNLLGLGDVGLRLDIFLHFGTLLAVFVFYFGTIKRIVIERKWDYLLKIAVSSLPVAIVGFACMDFLEEVATVKTVGCSLVFTGIVLSLTSLVGARGDKSVSLGSALWMGLAQAVAAIPGVSRSGMTISAARAIGVEPGKAAEFSFLMSAPPIAGAVLLHIAEIFSASDASGVVELPWGHCLFGAAIAALVGYFSLKLLVESLKRKYFWLFGPYCLSAGLLILLLI